MARKTTSEDVSTTQSESDPTYAGVALLDESNGHKTVEMGKEDGKGTPAK